MAASPQLSSIVERQGVALDALRGTADTGAPARLRAHVDRRRGAGRAAGRRRRRVASAARSRPPRQWPSPWSWCCRARSRAARASPTPPALAAEAADPGRAPPACPGTPQLLRAQVDGVPFPNYAAKFGWKPVGARADDPSGRGATTVYYEKGGRTIAYTIVSGDALDPPSDARSTTRAGVEYRVFRDGGRTVVTWERDGHTCVLSSTAARPAELLALADWRGKGAIPF